MTIRSWSTLALLERMDAAAATDPADKEDSP